MQQRYYDPVIGRFDSVDAVTALQGGPQHFNLYDYAFNNPFGFTDLDGRAPTKPKQCGDQPCPEPEKPKPEHKPKPIRDTAAERMMLRRGQLQKYYESRAKRGDNYASLANEVLTNSGFLGKLANMWLFTEVVALSPAEQKQLLGDGTYVDFIRRVNIGIANAHSNAVATDVIGVPGLLSSNQISAYHEDYFESLGLPRNTFGGSAFFGHRTDYWCTGCDESP